MSYKRNLPVPKDRTVWRYYVTRDSIGGELSGTCQLWYIKPIRVKHSYRVTWVCADHRDPGHLGEYRRDEVQKWFRVVPGTDLEMLRIETYATETELQEQAKK